MREAWVRRKLRGAGVIGEHTGDLELRQGLGFDLTTNLFKAARIAAPSTPPRRLSRHRSLLTDRSNASHVVSQLRLQCDCIRVPRIVGSMIAPAFATARPSRFTRCAACRTLHERVQPHLLPGPVTRAALSRPPFPPRIHGPSIVVSCFIHGPSSLSHPSVRSLACPRACVSP